MFNYLLASYDAIGIFELKITVESTMPHQLKDVFDELHVQMTPALANALIKLVNAYETRGTHPLAFNSYMLGVYSCAFTTQDRNDFFDLFNVEYKGFVELLKEHITGANNIFGVRTNSVVDLVKNFIAKSPLSGFAGLLPSDVRKQMSTVTSIDTNYKVISDPFNIFITYVIHLVYDSKLPQKLKDETNTKLVMFLQYKFFTSLVNHRFKYKPDEAVMTAMFEGLTAKFDIKIYGTWKNVMLARTQHLLDKTSQHAEALSKYNDDKRILYFITFTQTSIRNQINIITEEFMKTKEAEDRIGTYSNTGTNIEGEMILIDNVATYDIMVTNVYNDALSVTRFLDDSLVRMIAGMFTNIRAATLRSFIIAFSEYAVVQAKAGKSQLVKKVDGEELFLGPEILIENIVQKSFRYCSENRVDFHKPLQVLRALKDVYSSSRTTDNNILQIRASVAQIVLDLQESRRDTTLSALRIAFLLYITVLAYRYIKK